MKKVGRPLSFDRDEVLKKAMTTFWKSGYETTSITDLTTAMGITAPSLYTAFGDKKQLFLEAIRLYVCADPEVINQIDNAPTAKDTAWLLLQTSASIFTNENTPLGCFMASSTASGSANSEDVRRYVTDIRNEMRLNLKLRIDQDIEKGLLPSDTSAFALADLVFAIIQGMSVLARDGVKQESLILLCKQALNAWPENN
ncbi:TetR/AcrR family transcriptional regulator [Flavobacterium sp. W21_SRS_FM6]|uniref:TetR/AcrR family transcriptional regulator n=1 Tax=Flavobacterium sp. W21_SRS_FM6 TaxID=3240268 RepID=UPI003F906125